MASRKYEEKYGKERDVIVEHKKDGCPIDERRDEHTHTQPDWREAIDNTPMPNGWGKV